jgi:hypothetical protein
MIKFKRLGQVRNKARIKFWSENLKGRGQSEDLVDWWIVKYENELYRNRVRGCGLDSMYPGKKRVQTLVVGQTTKGRKL